MVGVAQLVEHLVVVQDVAGSSPVTHPTTGEAVARRHNGEANSPMGGGPAAAAHASPASI